MLLSFGKKKKKMEHVETLFKHVQFVSLQIDAKCKRDIPCWQNKHKSEAKVTASGVEIRIQSVLDQLESWTEFQLAQ